MWPAGFFGQTGLSETLLKRKTVLVEMRAFDRRLRDLFVIVTLISGLSLTQADIVGARIVALRLTSPAEKLFQLAVPMRDLVDLPMDIELDERPRQDRTADGYEFELNCVFNDSSPTVDRREDRTNGSERIELERPSAEGVCPRRDVPAAFNLFIYESIHMENS